MIEGRYVRTAHKLVWLRYDGQMLMNKKQMYTYIKTANVNKSNIQQDLYKLTYNRFRNGYNAQIVSSVENFMNDHSIKYYNH